MHAMLPIYAVAHRSNVFVFFIFRFVFVFVYVMVSVVLLFPFFRFDLIRYVLDITLNIPKNTTRVLKQNHFYICEMDSCVRVL